MKFADKSVQTTFNTHLGASYCLEVKLGTGALSRPSLSARSEDECELPPALSQQGKGC